MNLQPLYQDLYFRVASDHTFLQDTLASTAEKDDFVARLLKLHQQLYINNTEEKRKIQPVTLNIARSDYMAQGDQPQQIEYNTIASSFGVMSTGVAKLHKFLASRGLVPGLNPEEVLENKAEQGMVDALLAVC